MTLQDSNDFMTDNVGFGTALRKKGNQDVLNGLREFRDSFQEMMDSIKLPYDQCIDLLLKNVQLDPYFKEFYLWAKANNVPIVVLSGGMEPIIRALLKHLLGEAEANDFQIVSNNVKARPGKSINDEGGWEIVFHDDRYVFTCFTTVSSHGIKTVRRCEPSSICADFLHSGFGHDKSLEIRKYSKLPESQRPYLFYAGDGVSDLSAAKETDLMFAKKGRGELHTAVSREIVNDIPELTSI